MKTQKNIWRIFIAFSAVLLINWGSEFVNLQVDLTEEKRFTLSDVSKTFLHEKVESDINITLYLDGSVNSGFKRLEKASLSMLKQFQSQNKQHFYFNQVIIDNIKDKNDKEDVLKRLQDLNMLPINVIDEDNNGKRIQKAVYPWALVKYNGEERPVKLLLNVSNKSGEQNLNSSIENLEYQFTEAFRLLSDREDRRVAFLEGHGELGEEDVYDITTALSQYYSVDRGRIGDDPSILDNYKAVIIAEPVKAFKESDKYVLDQYLMNGGKLLLLVDGVKMSMDSLTMAKTNYGIYNDLKIGDMLFRYGVRIEANLLQDVQCALYPVNIAGPGETAKFQPLPWFYSPLLMPNTIHAISRNMSNVKSEFASSIDLVGNDDKIKKTILLSTSAQSKMMPVPIVIDLGQAVNNLDLKEFNAGPKAVAVLLEGEFSSIFADRMKPNDLQQGKAIRKSSLPTKMMVIADGDIIRNDLRASADGTQIVPLGYDMATNQVMFSNKDFLLNAINYLTDDEGWYTLRERSIKLRLLDKKELERRQYYRFLNVLIPLLSLFLLSLVLIYVRKRRFTK